MGERTVLLPDAVRDLRVVLTVNDLDHALQLFRDGLGLSVVKEWASPQGRGYVLALGQATLELIDQAQAEWIDQIEVGRRIAGPVRLVFEVQNIHKTIIALSEVGGQMLAGPVQTPWGISMHACKHRTGYN
jgi:lactoylglutathione lyase